MDGESFLEETSKLSSWSEDILSVVEAWENASEYCNNPGASKDENGSFEFRNSEASASRRCKKQKVNAYGSEVEEGQQRISHITVERNRRKQMNDHLSVLRSLMPCFYVKRGDQASIIGGVVEYINELQQVLQSLQAKKHRKAYTTTTAEVLSPRLVSSPKLVPSPRPSPMSPCKRPPLSPRLSLPISPRTPQPWMHSPSLPSPVEPSPSNSSTSSSINDAVNELVATSKSPLAEVEVKFSGPNLLLKTVSHRIPGQVVKIVSALQQLALQILHLTISTVDETMLNSFTIKVGIECQLSAEELAHQIQQTFCY